MVRNTRSLTWLGLIIFALALAMQTGPADAFDGPVLASLSQRPLAEQPRHSVYLVAPSAADFTFDKRVMLKVAYDPTQPCAGASDSLTVSYGAELVYCFVFTNVGTTMFRVHTLDDDRLGGFFEYAHDVAPRGAIVIRGFPPDPATADITNTATWTAIDEFGTTVIRTDSVTVRVLAQRIFMPVILR